MPINVNYKHPVIASMKNHVQHYNHEKYWRYHEYVQNAVGGKFKMVLAYLKLLYIKRCDAFNNCSFGSDIGAGAVFATPPKLPHGPNGIIISPQSKIGKNCTIYHQVTLGDDTKDYHNAPIVGDNVVIGAIHIGNNARIGAGAIVVDDVPEGAVAVSPKARIIIKTV